MGLQRVGHRIVPEHTHTNTTTVYILVHISFLQGFPCGSAGKESACNAGDLGFLGQEDPLEKGKATHSSILTWRIPWAV